MSARLFREFWKHLNKQLSYLGEHLEAFSKGQLKREGNGFEEARKSDHKGLA